MANIISVYYPDGGSHLVGSLKAAAELGLEYVLFNGALYKLQHAQGKLVKGIKLGGSNHMPNEIDVVKQ